MSSEEKLKPYLEWVSQSIDILRYNALQLTSALAPERLRVELTLYDVSTQKELIEVIERSIKAEENLAKTQTWFACASVFLASVQIAVALVLAKLGMG